MAVFITLGSLARARDVDVTGIQDGDILVYDSGTETFVVDDPASAVSLSLDELTDVVITAAATNDALVFNGTNWVDTALGSMAFQAANAVSITGGAIAGITDLAVADGGTGASNAADARTNLGLARQVNPATTSETVAYGDYVLATNAITITLPAPSATELREIDIKNNDANNKVVVPASGLIDGAASYTLSADKEAITVWQDGTNYFIK